VSLFGFERTKYGSASIKEGFLFPSKNHIMFKEGLYVPSAFIYN